MKWAKSLTLADVIYDKDHPVPLSRLGTKMTALHSIGQIETVGLSVDKLRAFCTAQKIAKWAKKTKEEVCDLIVETAIMRQQIADRTRQLLDSKMEEDVSHVHGVENGIGIHSGTQAINTEWAKRQLMSSVVVDPSHPVLVSKSSKARTSLISIGGVEVIRLSTEVLKVFCGEHGISRARKDKEDLCKDIAALALASRGAEGIVVLHDGCGRSEVDNSNDDIIEGSFVASSSSHNGLRTPIASSLYRSNLTGNKRMRIDDTTALRSDIQSLKTTLEEVTTTRHNTEEQEEREKFESYKSMLMCHVQLKQTIRDLKGKLKEYNEDEDQKEDLEADLELYRAQTKKMEQEISSFSFPSSSNVEVEDRCAV